MFLLCAFDLFAGFIKLSAFGFFLRLMLNSSEKVRMVFIVIIQCENYYSFITNKLIGHVGGKTTTLNVTLFIQTLSHFFGGV